MSQAHSYSTGLRSGAWHGSSAIWAAPRVLSKYWRTIRLLCLAAAFRPISSLRRSCLRSASADSAICALLIARSCSRQTEFVFIGPAMAQTCFQLKWNWMHGVRSFGRPGLDAGGALAQPDLSCRADCRRADCRRAAPAGIWPSRAAPRSRLHRAAPSTSRPSAAQRPPQGRRPPAPCLRASADRHVLAWCGLVHSRHDCILRSTR